MDDSDASKAQKSPSSPPQGEARRSFLAALVGAIAAAIPIGVGGRAILDPLRRGGSDEMVMVTKLSAVPEDGPPRRFTVEADRVDGWATHADTPVGAVYLRRRGETIDALNVVCPHAGCFVGVADDKTHFACPCHNSSFDFSGAVNDPSSPSPRDMDSLDVEVRNGDEVWIRFQNFLPGREDKTPT